MAKQKERLKGLSRRNIYISLLLGLSVSGFLIWSTFDHESFVAIEWTNRVVLFLVLALFLIGVRHFAYMYRLWIVVGKKMRFRQLFDSIVMWEFASVASPGIVGGAAVAMFILNREGLSMGKSTATVMVITILDNLFFIIASVVLFLVVGLDEMFGVKDQCGKDLKFLAFFGGLEYVFLAGISFSALITSILAYGAFFRPRTMKMLLIRSTRLPFLRKLKSKAVETGNEIIITAKEIKTKKAGFWIRSFAATIFGWMCKYLVVNALLTAFGYLTGYDQIVVMSRMLALWLIMLIPVTPGASGVAEVSFVALMCRYAPSGLSGALTLLWRFITYYPYLIIGAILMPRWLARTKRERLLDK